MKPDPGTGGNSDSGASIGSNNSNSRQYETCGQPNQHDDGRTGWDAIGATLDEAGELTYMCAGEIGADGSAALNFTHASDYTIVIDSAVMDGSETDSMPANAGSDTENGDAETQKAAAWIPVWLIVIGGAVVLAGIAVILLLRRRKPD